MINLKDDTHAKVKYCKFLNMVDLRNKIKRSKDNVNRNLI